MVERSRRAVLTELCISILFTVDALDGRQVWKLPYPSGKNAPEHVFRKIPDQKFGGWSWFPNGRMGIWAFDGSLWLAGIRAGVRQAVTSAISSETQSQPALSSDGKRLLFNQSRTDYMILSASLSDASVERVISSEAATGMPAWALHRNMFVYASERSGSSAIWMRGDDGERPIVTAESLPTAAKGSLILPILSPQADRVLYTRGTSGSNDQFNWISSLSGGPPVRLTNAKDVIERAGSWSPDGGRIVYWQFRNGFVSIMLVRTTGEATPVALCEKTGFSLPEWSPDGQWIKYYDAQGSNGLPGWTLISPDGKIRRSYGEPDAVQITFSADSKRLYGIRIEKDRRTLFSLDIATKEVKTIGEIGKDFTPSSYNNPGIRLSLSPDGKSLLYAPGEIPDREDGVPGSVWRTMTRPGRMDTTEPKPLARQLVLPLATLDDDLRKAAIAEKLKLPSCSKSWRARSAVIRCRRTLIRLPEELAVFG